MASSNSVPQKVDFKIKKGDTFKRVYEFKNADGTAADVTGYVPKMIFADATISPFTVGNGFTWGTGGDANKLYQSVIWNNVGKVKYEFEVTYASGEVETKFAGTITAIDEINE